jgi:hypothetical protein
VLPFKFLIADYLLEVAENSLAHLKGSKMYNEMDASKFLKFLDFKRTNFLNSSDALLRISHSKSIKLNSDIFFLNFRSI